MRLAEQVTFGGSGLDRAAEMRGGAEALLSRDDARVAVFWRGKPLLRPDGIAWLRPGHPALSEHRDLLFLGLDGAREEEGDGDRELRPRFAADISHWTPEAAPAHLDGFSDATEQVHPDVPGAAFTELRRAMTTLDDRAAELAATARALGQWHATHRFCARCGSASRPAQGGWQRDCDACGARHFPRVDPVVIMLILHGNDALVGRAPGWPEGFHSCLAGFVEPGETIEAAVRREVAEEVGIGVGAVRYLASQPWPFPSSLMLGCVGHATGRDIVLDPAEIAEARWVSREEMVEVLAGRHAALSPPRDGSIARSLLRHWIAGHVGA